MLLVAVVLTNRAVGPGEIRNDGPLPQRVGKLLRKSDRHVHPKPRHSGAAAHPRQRQQDPDAALLRGVRVVGHEPEGPDGPRGPEGTGGARIGAQLLHRRERLRVALKAAARILRQRVVAHQLVANLSERDIVHQGRQLDKHHHRPAD